MGCARVNIEKESRKKLRYFKSLWKASEHLIPVI